MADTGARQMAADEVLLASAIVGAASLRCYLWSEPTLSLGYFQSEQVRQPDPRLAGLPFVRRPSGGAALVHHHELTYALALPAGAPWQTGPSWLCRMHGIISAALTALGVTAQACGCEDTSRFDGILCFQHFTPGDLLLGTAKVAGSAQRKQRGAMLQHGGILLAASPYTPHLPGIRELSGQELDARTVSSVLVAEFARSTGWELVEADWTAAERRRLEELGAGKYTTDRWNRKR